MTRPDHSRWLEFKIMLLAGLLAYPVLSACSLPVNNGVCSTNGNSCEYDNECPDFQTGETCDVPGYPDLAVPDQQDQQNEGTGKIDTDGDDVPEAGPVTQTRTPTSYSPPGIVMTVTDFVTSTRNQFIVNSNYRVITATCRHELPNPIAGTSKCEGTARTRIQRFGPGFGGFTVAAGTQVIGADPSDVFLAEVTVTCSPPGVVGAPVPLTLDPQRFDVEDDGMGGGQCVIEGHIIESRVGASATGETRHMLTMAIEPMAPICKSDAGCPNDGHCIFGGCHAGAAGDFCQAASHCSLAAPFCVEGSCQTGEPFSSCYTDENCTTANSTCESGFCSFPP